MARFRKRPVVIEAFIYGKDGRPDWFCDKVTTNEIVTFETHCEISTLEGIMRGEAGDYIIKGIQGEIYPCKPDIFEATYEAVGPTAEEIDAALAEHNQHEEWDWIEDDSFISLEALRRILVTEMNDKRDKE